MTTSVESSALDREQPFELGTEHRFPLDLTARHPSQWEAYETSLREVWDPEDETLWVGFDPSAYDESHRRAGALVWSHRAWVEYPAIAESEAVLIRACLEPDVEVDLKYCLSMRAVERARSTDLSHLLAKHLGGYEPAPATTELAALLDGDLVRRVLHSDSDLDAYIAAHLAAQATIDLRMWERAGMNADEALSRLISMVTRDKSRMLEVAWRRLADVVPTGVDAARLLIAGAVSFVLAEEQRGRQVPVFLAHGEDRERLLAAHELAASAGLGGVSPNDQLAVAEAAIEETATRLGELGVHVDVPRIA